MKELGEKMKYQIDKRFCFFVCIYMFLSMLLVFLGYLFVSVRETADLNEAGAAFLNAVNREKEIYITNIDFQHDIQLLPDSISEEEKRCCLSLKNVDCF